MARAPRNGRVHGTSLAEKHRRHSKRSLASATRERESSQAGARCTNKAEVPLHRSFSVLREQGVGSIGIRRDEQGRHWLADLAGKEVIQKGMLAESF
jgi:hypothetical protein